MNEALTTYETVLAEIGATHPNVIVLDAGLASSMQTNDFASAFPDRYFNLGIAEQNAVSVASGLARRGFIPLLHSFSNFLARRAHDQIAVSVAWPGCNVKLIAGSCGIFDGRNGPSHMAIDDLSTVSSLPGISIFEPADQRQMRVLLKHAVNVDGPVYFRLRRFGMPIDLAPDTNPINGEILVQQRSGAVATVVAAGSTLEMVLDASRVLLDSNVLIDIVSIPILRPLTSDCLIASARHTGKVVVVENHLTTGGFGSAIGEVVEPLGIRMKRIGLPCKFIPAGDPEWQSRYCELDAESLAFRILNFISES